MFSFYMLVRMQPGTSLVSPDQRLFLLLRLLRVDEFGVGKRAPYVFGIGKPSPLLLWKRNWNLDWDQYSKRRPYNFGVGKRSGEERWGPGEETG